MEKIKTVELVRQIRNKEYIITKDLSDKDLILYFKNKAKNFNGKLLEKSMREKVNKP